MLRDLPPKILQDVYVDASPLQRRLYEDFAQSPASQQVTGALAAGAAAQGAPKAPHIFQARTLQCKALSLSQLHRGLWVRTAGHCLLSLQRATALALS